MKRGFVVVITVSLFLVVALGLAAAGGPEYSQLLKEGDKLCMKGEYAKAKATYRRAIVMDPGEESGWSKYDEAVAKLSSGVKAAPAAVEEEEEPGGC